jgi:hypothetical protein
MCVEERSIGLGKWIWDSVKRPVCFARMGGWDQVWVGMLGSVATNTPHIGEEVYLTLRRLLPSGGSRHFVQSNTTVLAIGLAWLRIQLVVTTQLLNG